MSGLDQLVVGLGGGGLARNTYLDMQAGQQDAQQRDQQLQAGKMQLDAAQQKQAHEASYQQDVLSYFNDPKPNALGTLMLKYPDKADEIKQSKAVLDEPARQSQLTQFSSLHNAVENNRADLARTLVGNIHASEKAKGIADPEVEDLIGQLDSKDPAVVASAMKQIKGFTQINLAALDPKFAESLSKLGNEQNHFTSTGDGAIYDQRSGDVVRQAPEKTQYRSIKNADGSESIVAINPEGGGQASGAAGGGSNSTGGAPRRSMGWTPRARDGGDNTDAAVDSKLAAISRATGLDIDAPLTQQQAAQVIAAIPATEGGKGSIADRNNNPGNIKFGGFARSLGATKDPNSGYAVFPTREAGMQAAQRLGQGYYARGQRTIRDIIEGKPVGGRQAPTGGTSASGVPKTVGAKVVFKSQPAAANPVDQATVDFYAQKIAAGGDLPQLGSGKESSQWRRAILSRAAEIQNGRGVSGGDSNLANADVKANRSALLQAQKQYTSTVGFEDTFQRNVKEVLRLAPQGVGGSAPIFNRWIQSGRKNVQGDPAVSAFNVAVNTAANEYAKLASGASGGAVTSDSARHEAMEILNNAQTLPQLQASIKQMQIDGHNRVVALDTQIKRLRGNISGAGQSSQTAPAAPKGGRMIGTYQGKAVYQLPNGKRVVAQ